MIVDVSCSLVVATNHRHESLGRCLHAVVAQVPRPDEVIVVDNSEGDKATRRTADRYGATYVVEPAIGASRARNAGARGAHGGLIAFLDDDVIPRPGWLPALLAPFQDPAVVAATGRIATMADGHGVGGHGAIARSFDLGADQLVIDRDSPFWFERANFGGVGFGAIMAIRADAFQRWRGFHPRIGRGTAVPAGEDNFAFFELIRDGGRIVYVPGALVENAEEPVRAEARAHPSARAAEASAHAMLLLVEAPGYRLRTLRFAMGGLVGRARPWHDDQGSGLRTELTRPQFVAALVRGPWLYLRSRLDHGWLRSWPSRADCDLLRRTA